MPFKRKNNFDLAGRVSFRVPKAVHKAIAEKAETEQKTISDVLRAETMQLFKQKTA